MRFLYKIHENRFKPKRGVPLGIGDVEVQRRHSGTHTHTHTHTPGTTLGWKRVHSEVVRGPSCPRAPQRAHVQTKPRWASNPGRLWFMSNAYSSSPRHVSAHRFRGQCRGGSADDLLHLRGAVTQTREISLIERKTPSRQGLISLPRTPSRGPSPPHTWNIILFFSSFSFTYTSLTFCQLGKCQVGKRERPRERAADKVGEMLSRLGAICWYRQLAPEQLMLPEYMFWLSEGEVTCKVARFIDLAVNTRVLRI